MDAFNGKSKAEIYRMGYFDGATNASKIPIGTISILGYDLSKLIEIIQDWESRQPKVLFNNDTVRVDKVSEGYVVWVRGEIIWKS